MKKFKFTLESYLKTKEREKDKKIEELNLLKVREIEILELIELINSEKVDIENKSIENLKNGVCSEALNHFALCISENNIELKYEKEKLHEIQNMLKQKQDELKKIMGEIKSIEKIKEKQYEMYLEELKKETEKTTEEFLNSNKKNDEIKVKF